MVAYYYPPVSGGGVQRTLKFAKYLPQFGWKPYILTVRSGYDYYFDESLEKDIVKAITVHRTRSIEPMKWIRKWVKRLTDYRTVKKENIVLKQGQVKRHPWLLKLKDSVFIPDGEIGWLPFAVLRGWRVMRRENIDLIYSTSSPYTDHIIALLLNKWTRKPWIADFRDPWSLNMLAPQFGWRRFVDRTLEKIVLRNTNKTIAVTEPIANGFRRIYPLGSYRTIPNGYDEEDFISLDSKKYAVDKFNITYTGILSKENSPNRFLTALSELLDDKPYLREDFLVRFVGQFDKPGEVNNYHFLMSLGLSDVVELISHVPHSESIHYCSSADVLLLIVSDGPGRDGIMTGKVFEYLRCGKPIFAVVPPEGVAAKLIRGTQLGVVAHPQSITEIKDTLSVLYKKYKSRALKKLQGRGDIDRYSRYHLTRMLAQECNELVQQG